MDKPSYQPPQGRLTTTIVIFLFIVMVLYTLFLLFQQHSATRKISDIEGQILSIEAQMQDFQDAQIKEVSVAEDRQTLLEENSTTWSKVLKKFQDLMPVSVFFSAYTVGSDGSINVSGLGDDYEAVADMINAMERSTDFDGVFVPSVTQGSTADGQDVVSFTLQVNSISE